MHTFYQTNIHNNASSDHRKPTLIYSTVRMTNYMREPMKKKSVNKTASLWSHSCRPYTSSSHINVMLTASDQTLMVFIVAMGPFTALLLGSFLFMISPKLSLEETGDYRRLLTRGL